MSEPLTEFRGAYLAEVEELIAASTTQLLAVEADARLGRSSPRPVRELFRAVHTIKGLSAMVGVEPIVTIAHRLETCLRAADRAGGRLALPAVELMLEGLRAIEQRVGMLSQNRQVTNPPAALLDALDVLDTAAVPPAEAAPAALALAPDIDGKLAAVEKEQLARGVAEGRRAVRIDFAPSRERAEAGFSITSVRERVAKVAEIVKVVPLAVPQSSEAQGGLVFALVVLAAAGDEELEAASGGAPVTTLVGPAAPVEGGALEPLPAAPELPEVEAHPQGMVRVDVERLDVAMERLSTLMVTRYQLARTAEKLAEAGADVRELRQIVKENERQLKDLRQAILRLRMVPVAEVLQRMPLLVRGLRRTTGKQVRLVLDVGKAEVDKAVGERIFPALMHLVRNAVDHAIEPPEERRRRGKPEEGTITVASHERSNTRLELVISDDGAGVDREAAARRAGRPVPETEAALLELLCLPGLSTRDEVTTTSGRGMGMDIVKRTIVDQLGGELALSTKAGAGSTFTVRVPLTISIVDAFTVEVAAQRFVVPVAMVEEVVVVDPERLLRAPGASAAGTVLLERRGEAVPVLGLARLFRLPEAADGGQRALVVRRNGQAVAFAVDRMVAQQEVLVRPLEDPLVRVPGVSGATDLGDGRPTLVLDLSSLSAAAAHEALPLPGDGPGASGTRKALS